MHDGDLSGGGTLLSLPPGKHQFSAAGRLTRIDPSDSCRTTTGVKGRLHHMRGEKRVCENECVL